MSQKWRWVSNSTNLYSIDRIGGTGYLACVAGDFRGYTLITYKRVTDIKLTFCAFL